MTRSCEAPWHCSAKRRAEIDELMDGGLPGPVDWTPSFPTFGRRGTPKIAEGLWHFSDAGAYILSMTDMDLTYKHHFIAALRALTPLMDKVHTIDQWRDYKQPVFEALTQLEIALPIFWCTSTRHHLLHAIEKIIHHGSFWATNMLVEERQHIKIRGMATNQRYIMGSIIANYELAMQCQASWRLDEAVPWSIPAAGR